MLKGKTLFELRELLDSKKISSKEMFEYFQKRIKQYNPILNAFLTEVDYKENKKLGFLKGIPVSFKDNFCTENVRTTASSKLLNDFVPKYSSTVYKRVINRGGVLQGKLNLDAWAHGSSTETSDYGVTKNPWDIERVPGGSSGGSAAVVASYLSPISLGSETAGSIRLPASWCGIVGLKPTYGRVSRYGVVAMASSTDSPGPLALCIKDAAAMLKIIAGKDPYDATSSAEEVQDYVASLDTKKTFTIGVPKEYLENIDEEVKNSVLKTLKVFEKLGCKIKDISLIDPQHSISVYTILQRAEVSSNLARYSGVRYGEDRSAFGWEAKKRQLLGAYVLSSEHYKSYYSKAQQLRTLIIEDFQKAFTDVDLIISPTAPTTALKIGDSNNYPAFGEIIDRLQEPSAIAGLCAVTFPTDLDKNGLPIGVQLIGNYFEEANILNLAFQYEQFTSNYNGIIQKVISKWE